MRLSDRQQRRAIQRCQIARANALGGDGARYTRVVATATPGLGSVTPGPAMRHGTARRRGVRGPPFARPWGLPLGAPGGAVARQDRLPARAGPRALSIGEAEGGNGQEGGLVGALAIGAWT